MKIICRCRDLPFNPESEVLGEEEAIQNHTTD